MTEIHSVDGQNSQDEQKKSKENISEIFTTIENFLEERSLIVRLKDELESSRNAFKRISTHSQTFSHSKRESSNASKLLISIVESKMLRSELVRVISDS